MSTKDYKIIYTNNLDDGYRFIVNEKIIAC